MKALFSLLLVVFSLCTSADQNFRVGVPVEPPIAFLGPDGKASGFAVDILQEAVKNQGWNFAYSSGNLAELLSKLEQGQLDLLVNVPYTADHRQRYLFSKQALFNNWGGIFTRNGSTLGSLLDLNGRRIGVVESNIHTPVLKETLNRFDLESELAAYASFEDVAAAVAVGEVDAGVFNRVFALNSAKALGMRPLPALFSPLEIRYAGSDNGGAVVLASLDAFLLDAKRSGASHYYAAFNKWFPKDRSYQLPQQVWWSLICLIALALGFLIGIELQRKRSQKKTERLAKRCQRLEQDAESHRNTRRQLHQLAYYDEITSLPNRLQFNERLHQALIDEGALVGVAMIDLDRFKKFNDTLGHEYGNALLRLVAKRIALSLNSEALLSRYGSDEFAILFEGKQPRDCVDLVQGVLSSLQDPITELGSELYVTASIGLSHSPTEAANISELLQQADIAMYRAKQEGGDTHCLYDADIGKQVIYRMELETSLRRALVDGEMWVEYQPQVDLKTKQVLAVEALLRWRHPQWGMVDTSEFIKVAEETGQIISLGEWVMEEVFAQAAQWREQGVKPFKVAVNLSSKQVRTSGFVALVTQLIDEYNFPADDLELEITEHLLMDHEPQTQQTMEDLRDLGVSLAIDDFGSGYSALSYLHRFPVDTLKIDKIFITNLHSDGNNKATTRAIVAMADQLNLRTVAECVEKPEQVEILSQMQCQAAQGFYFAKPLLQDELAAWVGKVA